MFLAPTVPKMQIRDFNNSYIKDILEKNGCLFTYLFGSQVTGDTGPISDIDIAVFLKEELDLGERFKRRLDIQEDLAKFFKSESIDIVVLNDAYPLLEHRILRQGKLIFSVDNKKRLDYETKAIMRYLDWQPHSQKFAEELLKV